MTSEAAGFREQPHTADWALEAWAPDLMGLFEQAARGMYALMHARLRKGPRDSYRLKLSAPDSETLLVAFLSELLYLTQHDNIGFDAYTLAFHGTTLTAAVAGAPIESIAKEIKAVTYHNLAVRETERGCEATLVFDV